MTTSGNHLAGAQGRDIGLVPLPLVRLAVILTAPRQTVRRLKRLALLAMSILMESWHCPMDSWEIHGGNGRKHRQMLPHGFHAQWKPNHVLAADVVVLLEES